MLKPRFYLTSDKDVNPIPLTDIFMGTLVYPDDTESFTFYGESLSDFNTFQVVDLSQDTNSYSSKALYTFQAKLYDENNELVCEFFNVMPTGCFSVLGQEQANILVDHVRYNLRNEVGAKLYERHEQNKLAAQAAHEEPITFHY